MKKNIVLTGFMGTGKSVAGKKLAALLDMEFVDTDSIIEEKEGTSIVRIFQVKGEEYFRDVESEVIAEASMKEGCVIAAGGGAVTREKNIENLKKKGVVICLTAEPSVIICRTLPAKDRPLLLKSRDALSTVRRMMKDRQACYARADYTIDTSLHSPDDTAREVISILKKGKRRDGEHKDKSA